MNTVTLPAHFDGKNIVLDQPYKLEPDAKLAVVVLTASAEDEEREDYLRLAQQSFAIADAENEPEYTLDDIKIWNPEYRGR